MAVQKTDDARDAELDGVLDALAKGVAQIKKRAELCKQKTQVFSRKELANSPPDGVNVQQLKKTRMVFMAMAEESLEDSRQPDDEVSVRPAKKGELTRIDARRARMSAASPLPRPSTPSSSVPRPMAGG